LPTALQTAIESGDGKALDTILGITRGKPKSNPDFTDERGLTPLHYAAYFGKLDIIKRILALGADPDIKMVKYGSTPLQWATYCGIKNAPKLDHRLNAAVIRELLRGGAQYDIMSAVANTDLAQVEKILSNHPAQAASKWMSGFSPLHVNHDLKIGKRILSHAAILDQRSDDGTTPLVNLCNRLKADPRIAFLYLEHGADVNARNDSGSSPLHGAVRRGHEEIVRILLEHGADKSLRNAKGETPYDKAVNLKKKSLLDLLGP